MRFLIVIQFLFLVACAEPKVSGPCMAPAPAADDARPDFLVIGDSISIGYTPFVRATFDQHDVIHNPCNAQWSGRGVANIDSWLAMRPSWDLVTFNHGLWDAKRTGFIGTYSTNEEYRANLHVIAQKIKAKTNNAYFVLTTEVLPGTPLRDPKRIVQLNKIATEVMAIEGIPVIDLYTESKLIRRLHTNSTNVHFKTAGYKILADKIASEIMGGH